MFKGISPLHVSLFEPKDTAELARLSHKNQSMSWPDDAVEHLHHITGGHPYLTQQLCEVVWNTIDDDLADEATTDIPTVRIDDLEQAVPEALQHATHAMEWLWDGLKPAQRVIASALAEAGSGVITQDQLEACLQASGVRILIGELQDAPKTLADWDLIRVQDHGYCFPSDMLRRWIGERKPLRRVQEEIDKIHPVADNLFQAAYGLYQSGQLEAAIPLFKQAIDFNPNHLKANQLLGEIYLAEGNTDEAVIVLERLYEYQPALAGPRLIQAFLKKLGEAAEEDAQLALCEKILRLNPNHSEATAIYQKIWLQRGDLELQQLRIDKFLEAYQTAYRQNTENFKPTVVKALIDRVRQETSEDQQLRLYEAVFGFEPDHSEAIAQSQKIWEQRGVRAYQNEQFQDALHAYQKANAANKIERLKKRAQIEQAYTAALGHLEQNERLKARQLLVRVLAFDPAFKEAARYLYLAVTGVDPQAQQSRIQVLEQRILELEAQQIELVEDEVESLPLPADDAERTLPLETFEFETVTVNVKGEIVKRTPGAARQHIEKFGNGVTLDMVAIPGGTFLMGQREAEKARLLELVGKDTYEKYYANELPQHQVTLTPFLLGKYPVTQAQWLAVMGNNPSNFKGERRLVEQVSWEEAVAFCQKLSELTGHQYRLPTEAEWEYACRAGTLTPFAYGDTITTELANYDGNYVYQAEPKGQYRQQTTDVGMFPPNAFGLYDMHGNVWEWCQDIFASDAYTRHQPENPLISSGGSKRALRGGGWGNVPQNLRSARRNCSAPSDRNDSVGFRVSRTG